MTVRRQGFLVFFIGIVLFVSGCGITPRSRVNMDPELPAEQTALVAINAALDVYAYNGIDVKKTWYPTDKPRVVKVTLPAGETVLSLDMYAKFKRGNTYYFINMEDIEVRFNFEAGGKYIIKPYTRRTEDSNLFVRRHKVMLGIWGPPSPTAKSKKILKSWELGEF